MSDESETLLAEIRAGLARPQKELPSKLFYDERGSELFEEITRLPEYYLTRAEHALLRDHIGRWVGEQRPRSVVELGAGNAEKTRLVLDAMLESGGTTYIPVDISADFLARTTRELRRDYDRLEVIPVAADFTRSLSMPPSLPRPVLLTFLGSTIGNFPGHEAAALLRRVGDALRPADRFLLGVDLRKDIAVLEAAYNDQRGVTADFNLNVLHVVNRRFGADFDPAGFEHRAFYNTSQHCIEMHLVSTRLQVVRIPGAAPLTLQPGETIRTEVSCKYDRRAVAGMFGSATLRLLDWRTDAEDRFAIAVGSPDTRPGV